MVNEETTSFGEPASILARYDLAESHLFRVKDEEILFNVETLLACRVDQLTSAIVSALSSADFDQLRSLMTSHPPKTIAQVIKMLRQGQFLVPKGERPFSSLPERTDQRTTIQSVNFNLTHACNLACRYCYGVEGRHPARTVGPNGGLTMSEDVARRCSNWALFETEANDGEFSFGCFGGEPLVNFGLIKKMQAWLEEANQRFSKRFKLSLFTNATLLEGEVLDFVVDHDIGLIVSLDGPKEVHDRNRPFPDGRGSYERVVRNVRALLDRQPRQLTARSTFARWNMLDGFSLKDIVAHLLSMGFSNVWVDCISERGGAGAFLPEDIPKLREMYLEVAEEMVGLARQGVRFDFSNLSRFVVSTRLVEEKKVSWGCGAGRGFACLAPDGGLYVCHRFTGMADWRLGDVFTGVSKRLSRQIIARQTVRSMTGCQSCWMRYLCGGGCLKIHLEGTGSPYAAFEDVYCALRRIEAEMGLYINSQLSHDQTAQLAIYGEKLAERLSARGPEELCAFP